MQDYVKARREKNRVRSWKSGVGWALKIWLTAVKLVDTEENAIYVRPELQRCPSTDMSSDNEDGSKERWTCHSPSSCTDGTTGTQEMPKIRNRKCWAPTLLYEGCQPWRLKWPRFWGKKSTRKDYWLWRSVRNTFKKLYIVNNQVEPMHKDAILLAAATFVRWMCTVTTSLPSLLSQKQ